MERTGGVCSLCVSRMELRESLRAQRRLIRAAQANPHYIVQPVPPFADVY